jgi:hypothetical protein
LNIDHFFAGLRPEAPNLTASVIRAIDNVHRLGRRVGPFTAGPAQHHVFERKYREHAVPEEFYNLRADAMKR